MSFSFHKLGLKAANARDAQSQRRKATQGMPIFTAFLLGLAGLATALLLGMVIALGAIQLTIMLAGLLIFIPILLFVDTKKLLPLLFVVVFFVSGTAQYFFNLRLATWMASGLAALFFARTILEKTLANRLLKDQHGDSFGGATRIVVAAWIYLAFYAFSIFMGHASTVQLISVLRFCLPMFGVLFAMYWFQWSDRRLLVLWGGIVVIAVAQLPLALYQHFFNIASMGWDSVVGSFGGNMSPVLVLFTVVAMLYVLARWVQGITPVSHVVGMFIVGLAIILLGEVKAVFIWLPLGVFWVVRRKVLKNILVFVMFVALMCSISSGIFMAYHALYWGSHTKTDTMEEKVNSVSGYVVDPNGINYVTGEISRGASLALWYQDPVPSIQERLIGYGPSASSTSQNIGRGYVAARYRNLQLGATGLASLLWDVGILGTLVYVSIFILGIRQGARYVARSQACPERLAMADTSTVTLILLVSTLIYNRTMIDEPSIQLLCYFSLGCIVQFSRYGKPAADPAKQPSQPMPGHTLHGALA